MFKNLREDKFTLLINALEKNTRVHQRLLAKQDEKLPNILYTEQMAQALGVKSASLRCYMWQGKKGYADYTKYLPCGRKGNRPYWRKERVKQILGFSDSSHGEDQKTFSW